VLRAPQAEDRLAKLDPAKPEFWVKLVLVGSGECG